MAYCATHFSDAGNQSVQYSFTLSGRGERVAHAWVGNQIAILIEACEDGRPAITAPPQVQAAVLRMFDAVYLTYVHIAGGRPPRQESPFRGRVVIQVPADNAGAGGLAGHAVAGISVGLGLVKPCVERWERAVANGAPWLPSLQGEGLEGLRFGSGVPELASVDQVFLYEFARNFWHPWFNKKIDWACNGDPACWGWWTVGMNNAMAVIVPHLLNLPMYYFGLTREQFRNRMVAELGAYAHYRQTAREPFAAWRVSLMPWKPKESVNDLMTALIIKSYERLGGENWIRGFYQSLHHMPDINATEAGEVNFQEARDNLYRMWSAAAATDMRHVFTEELGWELSRGVQFEISAKYSGQAGASHLTLRLLD